MNSDTTVGDVSEFLFVEMGEFEGRVSIASNAVVYTTATFALQNACWGSAPNPFDLHFPMQATHPGGMLFTR